MTVLRSKDVLTSWEPIGSLKTRQFYPAAVSVGNQLIALAVKDMIGSLLIQYLLEFFGS